jgi:hypothetical protein
MADDLDRLFKAAAHEPPPGFAARVAALARGSPQVPAPPPLSFWRLIPLAAGAGLGALLVAEFALFAFITAAAQ